MLLFVGVAAHAELTVRRDGVLLNNKVPFRGIGVNYYDVFDHLLKAANDPGSQNDFRRLKDAGIPFIRFGASGYWPIDNQLYFNDKEAYFRLLDGVVKAAEASGLGLIPSLFWNYSTVPDLMHEPMNAWGDPKSRTQKFMRRYTRELVKRYRRSPAIWAWEFGNELNDQVELPPKFRPGVAPELGTPAARSEKDDMTSDVMLTAFRQFAKVVRKLDKRRIISSGNDVPRENAFHLRTNRSATLDTPQQWAEMLLLQNASFPVLSGHIYMNRARALELIAAMQQVATGSHKPLFLGEFGPTGNDRDAGNQQFRDLLAAVERARVPISAVWNFSPRRFNRGIDWNISFDNANAWMLTDIAAANARMQVDLEP